MRLGILGGTFDPIHIGHLAAARAAIDCAGLDRVLFVPSSQPPHRAAATAPAEDRLAMTRLAVEGEPRFEVSDIEVTRGGVSYTADTLSELRRAHRDDDLFLELFLILGWDAARLFNTWHEPDRVRALASVVIVGRPGTETPKPSELAAAGLDPERVVECFVETPDVSATELRHALAAGESVAGRVPPAVERYMAQRHLYRDNRNVGT
ncbi:MAG TPA: nicotinate-nucleotide adenylyltransferase [Candidatus Dormibacteraeota bacterium]|nr:nicotinate-nucleotide adenylyltransferase [Candidatus Dormibacteraeota bacterium]